MTEDPRVRTAGANDRAAVLNTMLLGFAADPMARWTFPRASGYVEAMPPFIEAFGGRAFEHGTAFVTEGFGAAALWLPPGVEPDDAAMGRAQEGNFPPEIEEDVGGMLEGMARYHPREPHWYLPMIAADPRWFGKGLGSLLMKHALRRCDEEGMPAYLESSNPRNIPFYERFGFRTIGEIQCGSAPVMTPMLRRAS